MQNILLLECYASLIRQSNALQSNMFNGAYQVHCIVLVMFGIKFQVMEMLKFWVSSNKQYISLNTLNQRKTRNT